MTNAGELGSNRQATPPTTPLRESSQSTEQHTNLPTLTFAYRLAWTCLLFATLFVFLSPEVIATTSNGSPGRQLSPPACLHAMLTWESKCSKFLRLASMARPYPLYVHSNDYRQETELAIHIRKATSIEEVSPKRTTIRRPKSRDRGLQRRRETRARMHCVHMGPQELSELLAGHESVRLSLLSATSAPILLAHSEAACASHVLVPVSTGKDKHGMRRIKCFP
jgi:hypothetical protein